MGGVAERMTETSRLRRWRRGGKCGGWRVQQPGSEKMPGPEEKVRSQWEICTEWWTDLDGGGLACKLGSLSVRK